MKLHWRQVPGLHRGPHYLEAEHSGLWLEMRFDKDTKLWEWSFYDPDSYDPDTAVSCDHAYFRDNAEAALIDYITDYLSPTQKGNAHVNAR